jgi:cytochrome d ubiquinol oxidase subunit II
MNSIAPVWDGNETWLVLGGGGLLAAFPLAYSIILPATYPLIIAMLLGLVFRGVAFEFRWRHAPSPALGRGVHHRLGRCDWRRASRSAPFFRVSRCGAMLLRAVGPMPVAGSTGYHRFRCSPARRCSSAMRCSAHAGWCGKRKRRVRHMPGMAFWLAIAMLVALAAVSAATPFLSYAYWRRWFAVPGVFVTAQVPLLVLVTAVLFFRSLARGGERLPFLLALGLFLLGFVGLGVSMYPYIVPRA